MEKKEILEQLKNIKQEKTAIEAELDDACSTELGFGRMLRAASRHFSLVEIYDVLNYVPSIDMLLDQYPEDERSSRKWRIDNAVNNWYACHEAYESLIASDKDVYRNIRFDRYVRALVDSKNWKI